MTLLLLALAGPARAARTRTSPGAGDGAIEGVRVEAEGGGGGATAGCVRVDSGSLLVEGAGCEVVLDGSNRFLRFPEPGAHLRLVPSATHRFRVARSAAGRPEIVLEPVGLRRTAGFAPARLEVGRFLIELGAKGRLSVNTRGGGASVALALLLDGVPAPAGPASPAPRWHVLTFLEKNEVSDLDSRYWLGDPERDDRRIQFSSAEYEAAGMDVQDLRTRCLEPIGVSGDGRPALLAPDAARAFREMDRVHRQETGASIRLSGTRSGFRTWEDQERSWKRHIQEDFRHFHRRTGELVHPRKVAVPGFSQHGTGTALDLDLAHARELRFRRLAFHHGFIRSEIRTRWHRDRFAEVWVDRPHFLFVGTDDQPVAGFPPPDRARPPGGDSEPSFGGP